jgi:putative transposase
VVTTKQRRQVVTHLLAAFGAQRVSARRACHLLRLSRSRWHYQARRGDDRVLRERLRALAAERPRWGYQQLHVLLRREGYVVNHKKVLRLYREEGLAVLRRRRKKRVAVPRVPLPQPSARTERWSMDFISDALADGRPFRCLTLVDDFTRECPAIEAAHSLPAWRVIHVLDRLALERGLPRSIVCDNGPEFAGKALDLWAHQRGVALQFIRPGKPMENAFIESFNGKFRDECLSVNWFTSLADAQLAIEAWRLDYNECRPHTALARRTPAEFTKTIDPKTPKSPQRLTA